MDLLSRWERGRRVERRFGWDCHGLPAEMEAEKELGVSGRSQILEFGIVPTPPQELATYVDLHDELWTIIEGLSLVGLFLMNTDHLTDRDLYCRLYYKILDEPCKMMPPEADCAEYIECLHPMDLSFPRAHLLSARGTVAPRCATGENPVFVSEVDGQSVHLGFDDPIQKFPRQHSLNAANKLT